MKRPFHCVLAALSGVALAVALLWLNAAATVRAEPDTRYVALDGTDSGDCSTVTGRCRTIQYAINVASPGDEIHVAGGTYTSAVGTVAVITKPLVIIGAFDPATFDGPDPDMYETVLDAGWGGSVISITNADDVFLQHLTLTHGDGLGNCPAWPGSCGGGIYTTGTNLHVGQCVITDNVGGMTGGANGGGIYADAGNHVVEIWESRIVSNTAAMSSSVASEYGHGGGVYIQEGVALLWENEVLDNVGSANHGGSGGIHLSGVTCADVLTNIIRGNKANLSPY